MYWIPAEDLDDFNRNLVGMIEVVAEFQGNALDRCRTQTQNHALATLDPSDFCQSPRTRASNVCIGPRQRASSSTTSLNAPPV